MAGGWYYLIPTGVPRVYFDVTPVPLTFLGWPGLLASSGGMAGAIEQPPITPAEAERHAARMRELLGDPED